MKIARPLIPMGHALPGDCWRSCIATLIERPCSEIPHFVHECGEVDFVTFTRDWLREQGFDLFETNYPATWALDDILKWASATDNPGLPFILSGHPPCDDPQEGHAVIVQDGAIVHDPGDCGLDGPSSCRDDAPGPARWWVHVICLSRDWSDKR